MRVAGGTPNAPPSRLFHEGMKSLAGPEGSDLAEENIGNGWGGRRAHCRGAPGAPTPNIDQGTGGGCQGKGSGVVFSGEKPFAAGKKIPGLCPYSPTWFRGRLGSRAAPGGRGGSVGVSHHPPPRARVLMGPSGGLKKKTGAGIQRGRKGKKGHYFGCRGGANHKGVYGVDSGTGGGPWRQQGGWGPLHIFAQNASTSPKKKKKGAPGEASLTGNRQFPFRAPDGEKNRFGSPGLPQTRGRPCPNGPTPGKKGEKKRGTVVVVASLIKKTRAGVDL